MTVRPSVGQVGSLAKLPGQGTAPLATGYGANAQPVRAAAGDGSVQWGNANGTTFRFDPHHAPSRPGLPLACLPARRAASAPVKRATSGSPSQGARGRGRTAVVSGFESSNQDSDEVDDDDAAESGVSMMAGASAGTGSGSQDRGAQDDRGGGGGGGSGQSGPGNERITAVADAQPGSAQRQPAGMGSALETELDMPSLLQRLGSGDTSVSLRQRVLAAVLAPASPQPACESLRSVRAALVDAVNARVLIPTVDPRSPDQNCLIPLLLLRALRQMPPSMRAAAQVRAAAMLSMARRVRSASPVQLRATTTGGGTR